MRRGWEVQYKDGTVITEEQMDWKKIPKFDIIRLTLKFDGREWNITDRAVYVQKKRGSAIPGVSDSFRIESRSIGYYDDSQKIWYTVNEHTGKMTMSVEAL